MPEKSKMIDTDKLFLELAAGARSKKHDANLHYKKKN